MVLMAEIENSNRSSVTLMMLDDLGTNEALT